jgi:hypothetical protein
VSFCGFLVNCVLKMGQSCPVCSQNLADLGSAAVQEDHVRTCLEGGAGASSQSARYLVYKLPVESALIGTECEWACTGTGMGLTVSAGVICLEEFLKGAYRVWKVGQ